MKISGTRPPMGPAPVRRANKASGAKKIDPAPGAQQTADIADAVRVIGIPDAELTPRVRAAISQLMDEVVSLRDELDRSKRRIDELEREADEDTLLPVLNRRAFVRELTRARSALKRYAMKASLIYIDMNNFKEINDTYGHTAGDAALAHVAEVLKSNVRGSDIVGRLGGDEFGVILMRATKDQAEKRVEVIAQLIERKPLLVEGIKLGMSIAFGVAEILGDGEVEETLADADRAMFEHKKQKTGGSRNEPRGA